MSDRCKIDIRQLAICYEELVISQRIDSARFEYAAAVVIEDWDNVYHAVVELEDYIRRHNPNRIVYTVPEFLAKAHLCLEKVNSQLRTSATSAIQNQEFITPVKGLIIIAKYLREFIATINTADH